jgi:hypothetical protein
MPLNIDQWILILTGVATVATAVATFLTVREIKRQREASYRPDLVPSHQYAHAYLIPKTNNQAFSWSKSRRDDPATINLSHDQYSITFFNIGMGPAKNIVASWMVEIEPSVKLINSLAQRSFTALLVETSSNPAMLTISGPNGPRTTHSINNQLRSELEHVLPASLDRNGVEIWVPSFLLALLSLQITLGMRADRDGLASSPAWTTSPKATLLLTFADVAGATHAKEFGLAFEILSIASQLDDHGGWQVPTAITTMVKLKEIHR